jgi:hypothetical protein
VKSRQENNLKRDESIAREKLFESWRETQHELIKGVITFQDVPTGAPSRGGRKLPFRKVKPTLRRTLKKGEKGGV